MIYLLNGASSAGKSTVARALAERGVAVVSWDACAFAIYAERARERDLAGDGTAAQVVARLSPAQRVDVCGDVAVGEIDRRLLADVRRHGDGDQAVAVDTILRGDDDTAELLFGLADRRVCAVLLECDALTLVRRIVARNRSDDIGEHRTLAQALGNMAQLYVAATGGSATLPLAALERDASELAAGDPAAAAALATLRARFGAGDEVAIAPALDYDLVIDTTATTPAAVAARIAGARDGDAAERNRRRLAALDHRELPLPADVCEPLAGTYHAAPNVAIDVGHRDGRLSLRLPGRRRLELRAVAADDFVARTAPLRVRFAPGRLLLDGSSGTFTAYRR